MRYSKNLFRQAISQWRDCYIDYEYLKIFISVIKKIVQELQEMSQTIDEDQTNRNTRSSGNSKSNEQTISISKSQVKLSPERIIILNDVSDKLKKIIQEINVMFCSAFQMDVLICQGFCYLKFHQLQQKYQLFFMYASLVDHKKQIKVLLPYVQYTYIETVYLTRMYESNIEGQRKILKKHKKNAKKIVETPSATLPEILESKKLDKFVDQIENYYVEVSHDLLKKKQKTKLSRNYLRGLAKDPETTNKDSFTFGLWVGSFTAVIVFMSFMLAYQNKSVQTDPIFNRDFPTWRGISFIIFYIWILGLNVYFFQKYMISHKIIFDFASHHYSNSTRIFKIAGLLSTVFVVLFTLYALNLADFYKLHTFDTRYLSLIVWVVFLVFMFNPLPVIYFRSRMFSFLLFLRIVASPFIGVPFVVTWATDQLLSLITPFEDMVYSICYFTGELDFTDPHVTNNKCRNPAKVAVFIFATIVFAYRIVQCMRQGYDKGKYWREFQFYNTIKYIFSLLTLVFSYVWKSGNSNIFAGWLTFAIISTLYSYVWDLKVDWFLLDRKAQYCLLRDKLTYLPRNYYIFMFLNLVLRLAWVMTLSQNITDKMFGSPELFRLVAGALEIIRRGIWNLLRVEREHLKNCEQFKALPSIYKKLENNIKLTIDQNKDKINVQSVQRIGQQKEMEGIEDQLIQIQIQNEQNEPQNKQVKQWKPETYKDIQQKVQKHEEFKKQLLDQLQMKETSAKQLIKIAKANLKG